MRIFEQIDVIVAANKINSEVIFTSTNEIPRTLIKVWTLHKTATNDLLVYNGREIIADVDCSALPVQAQFLVFNQKVKVGNALQVGFREGAGAGHTASISVESEIPD